MTTHEWFDIYDADNRWRGTAPRHEVHRHGYWHHSFQCWIVQDRGEERYLLFQLRHPDKDTYPGRLDISSAGHLTAGETVRDGSRELAEELGLAVPFEELYELGVYAQDKTIRADLIDREFCHVFLYRSDRTLTDYVLQKEEVTGLFLLRLADVKRLVRDRDAEAIAEGIILDGPEGTTYREETRTVVFRDLVPHETGYYEWVLQAAEAYRP
ncbi:NUDIX domain-containing protein [Paenibacillus sp. J31TS4]|uniref:NUDIX hydrolase n=1 Tax=Paenibacillus sp. J31TS4 TaxID=2807195 RepID=UPI001BCD3E7D|nr:NUDIX domain-containing protein [Paenibacillus sp. J31TS4]